MEAAQPSGGGGGPAPFLLKTYEMVDDTSTDEIVSWSASKNSFVVWNPPEFARLLLPTYFKHNNFSSFIRQLNTYGFRKIDPERWEFANEDFVKDQKHLLKNIHRRKPIHSHSHPPGSSADPERTALDEEIERLSREKAQLEAKLLSSKQQHTAEKLHFEDLAQRVSSMEKRQDSLLTFMEKAVQNPTFVEHLARKIESMDFSLYNKKRRLPSLNHSQNYVENGSMDNHTSSRPEFGNIFHHDFTNKLRLELSPAVSDVNVVSHCTQSSTEEGGSPLRKISGDARDAQIRTEGLFCSPEAIELSDTGTSFALKMNSSLLGNITRDESCRLHQLQHDSLKTNEDYEGPISCHLNLSLASSSLQGNRSPYSARIPQVTQEVGKTFDSGSSSYNVGSDIRAPPKSKSLANEDSAFPSSEDYQRSHQDPVAAPARVNDVFWEQFLTERPGSSDNEEASSSYRATSNDEPEDKSSSHGMSSNAKTKEQLTL